MDDSCVTQDDPRVTQDEPRVTQYDIRVLAHFLCHWEVLGCAYDLTTDIFHFQGLPAFRPFELPFLEQDTKD